MFTCKSPLKSWLRIIISSFIMNITDRRSGITLPLDCEDLPQDHSPGHSYNQVHIATETDGSTRQPLFYHRKKSTLRKVRLLQEYTHTIDTSKLPNLRQRIIAKSISPIKKQVLSKEVRRCSIIDLSNAMTSPIHKEKIATYKKGEKMWMFRDKPLIFNSQNKILKLVI